MHVTKSRALAIAATLALAACSGSTGSPGPAGQDGTDGTSGTSGTSGATGATGAAGQDLTATAKPESCAVCHKTAGTQHQAIYNSFTDGLSTSTSKLTAQIVSVATTAGTTAGTFKSTLTFTLKMNGQPYIDAVDPATVGSAALGNLKQKTYYFVSYDGAGKFPTATATTGGANFSYGSPKLAEVGTGKYTVVKDNLTSDPGAAANAFVYAYFGDTLVMPVKGHYNLMDNIVSVAQVVNGAVNYTSAANVAACEKCHPAPYSKHGYRQAHVANLNDFVACKACHTDQRNGSDHDWQVMADDPVAYAAAGVTDAQRIKYAYTANVMNDTHMSHAMEFAYPQSMANCATCHEGKLAQVLTDANFNLTTCKSCHPVTGPEAKYVDGKRAPSLTGLMTKDSLGLIHTWDLYTYAGSCTVCHTAGGAARPFNKIHTGYDKIIYADDVGTKYSSIFKVAISGAAFDSATKVLTFTITATESDPGVAALSVSNITPTVAISLYGYDTKDFIVSSHGSQPDGKRNLEWATGSSSNGPRLQVVSAGAGIWNATANLSTWADKIADGTVKRAEIGVMPALKQVVGTTTTTLALDAATKTFGFAANGFVASTDIVDVAKCNKCHDALATTFHSPDRGGSVVNCRICHVGLNGGSHLEMQSRSIDSYVHAIHSFQAFDYKGYDFGDDVVAMRYEEHTETASYPNFTILNCESCHNPGTYEVPDQAKSMPGVLSAAGTNTTRDRSIGAVPSYVTGPASRACGSCHRAVMINEDAAGDLASFNQHTAANGTLLEATTGVIDDTIAKIMGAFK